MSKVTKRPFVAMPTTEEDRAITAAAKSDPDALIDHPTDEGDGADAGVPGASEVRDPEDARCGSLQHRGHRVFQIDGCALAIANG